MGRPKKYKTEEERKAAKREKQKQWREDNPEYFKKYYKANKEAILDMEKQYRENNKEKKAEYNKKYYDSNKESILENTKQRYETNPDYFKQYRENNKEKKAEYNKKYRETKNGRASYINTSYKTSDKEKGLTSNLTPKWIVENIFSGQSCIYCGDSDWKHLGCDRIDNSKGHLTDNVVCACGVCNIEREIKNMSVPEFVNYRELHKRICDLKKSST